MPLSPVRHFMSKSVLTVLPDTSLVAAARQMSTAKVSFVVVCEGDRPIGVITERDITRAFSHSMGRSSTFSVVSYMSNGVHTLPVDASCTKAMALLERQKIRRIVLVDTHGALKGVITQSDLLRAHTHEIENQKQVLEERVVERTQELEKLNERLTSLARVDPMLEIGNRRAMDEALEQLEDQAVRYKKPYAMALIDVDFFKPFNDHYGHAAGDEVLKRVAQSMKESVRGADAVYRYGGEEFLALFPEVPVEGAVVAADRLRRGVEALDLTHEYSDHGRVTVSIGVAAEDQLAPCWQKLLICADEALYVAKRSGRNRTELASHLTADDRPENSCGVSIARKAS